MTVGELKEALDDYGDHLTVVIAWDEDEGESITVEAGLDADGVAACHIVVL